LVERQTLEKLFVCAITTSISLQIGILPESTLQEAANSSSLGTSDSGYGAGFLIVAYWIIAIILVVAAFLSALTGAAARDFNSNRRGILQQYYCTQYSST